MKDDVVVKNGIKIPFDELEIATSRAGGPGGQHVNKADTRITVRWNVGSTQVLTDEQKERVIQKLQSQLTQEHDLVVHSAVSRSQLQNKKEALRILAEKVRKALHVSKTRMKTRVPKAIKEARLQDKARRGALKKMRIKKFDE